MPFCFLFYAGAIFMFLSSQQWFFLWLSMELSTITFIALFFYEKSKMESITLYFLIQSIASFFILFSMINNETNMLMNLHFDELMFLGVLLKLGMAPFHNWIPTVVLQTKKMMASVLLLAQKIIPFMWLLMFSLPILKVIIFSIINLVWLSPQNLFQNSLKMLITMSSISHSSWLVMACVSMPSWQLYFLIYTVVMIPLLALFNLNLKNIFQMNERTPLFLILLTLGGLPPLMGFFPKLMVILEWTQFKMILILSTFLLLSIIDLFVYTRLGMMSTIQTKKSQKWMKVKQTTKKFLVLNLLVLMIMWI